MRRLLALSALAAAALIGGAVVAPAAGAAPLPGAAPATSSTIATADAAADAATGTTTLALLSDTVQTFNRLGARVLVGRGATQRTEEGQILIDFPTTGDPTDGIVEHRGIAGVDGRRGATALVSPTINTTTGEVTGWTGRTRTVVFRTLFVGGTTSYLGLTAESAAALNRAVGENAFTAGQLVATARTQFPDDI